MQRVMKNTGYLQCSAAGVKHVMEVCMLCVVCAVVVSALEGKDCREAMKTVADNSSIPHDRLSHVVAGMYRILTEATRIPTSSLKQEVGGCFNVLGHMYCIYNMY